MPTELASEIWQENLKALEAVDPALAERLGRLPIPPTVEPATGRDDHPTFRIDRGNGQTEYLGRTSMPSISAEGLLAQFSAGSGNVALAGIGSGLEAKLLAERLGRHRAVFVLETEPLHLALAMRLWHVAGRCATARSFRCCPTACKACASNWSSCACRTPAWNRRVECSPGPGAARLIISLGNELLEEAAARIRKERNDCLSRHLSCLGKAHRPDVSPNAVAVLTTAANVLAGCAAQSLAEGAAATGLKVVACWPDNPRRSGPLAGLSAAAELAESQANVQLLLVDQCRNHWPLQDYPHPIISRLTRPDQPGETMKPDSSHDDWIVATSQSQREQARIRRLAERTRSCRQAVYQPEGLRAACRGAGAGRYRPSARSDTTGGRAGRRYAVFTQGALAGPAGPTRPRSRYLATGGSGTVVAGSAGRHRHRSVRCCGAGAVLEHGAEASGAVSNPQPGRPRDP